MIMKSFVILLLIFTAVASQYNYGSGSYYGNRGYYYPPYSNYYGPQRYYYPYYQQYYGYQQPSQPVYSRNLGSRNADGILLGSPMAGLYLVCHTCGRG